jgi:PqqD family protein of HPr-rel-A system
MAESWRVSDPSSLCWREWDGEIVLYDGGSGDVHHLDALASQIFETLLNSAADLDGLTSRVAASLQLERSPELTDAIALAVWQLQLSGLFEPVDA